MSVPPPSSYNLIQVCMLFLQYPKFIAELIIMYGKTACHNVDVTQLDTIICCLNRIGFPMRGETGSSCLRPSLSYFLTKFTQLFKTVSVQSFLLNHSDAQDTSCTCVFLICMKD